MIYREITCKTACNRIRTERLPYSWDLNVYRGCEHGCKYCYALYSHDYLGSEQYFEEIYVKTNVAERLEEQLKNRSWDRKIVNLGGVTDSYQPAEAHYVLMPAIIKLLKKYKTPCIISTKSELILRDLDLFADLARTTYVGIAVTITTAHEAMRKLIEPNAAVIDKRFRILKQFAATEALTGMHFMPIIPFLNDGEENIEALFARAKESDVDYIIPGRLNLIGKTKRAFMDFIKRSFPKLHRPLFELYSDGETSKEYKQNIYLMLNRLKRKYSLSIDYAGMISERLSAVHHGQRRLF